MCVNACKASIVNVKTGAADSRCVGLRWASGEGRYSHSGEGGGHFFSVLPFIGVIF